MSKSQIIAITGFSETARKPRDFQPYDKVFYIPRHAKTDLSLHRPGIIKRLDPDGIHAFIWYHEGCTAARTRLDDIVKAGCTRFHDKIHSGCNECMPEFKVGDRIIRIHKLDNGYMSKDGTKGVILDIVNDRYYLGYRVRLQNGQVRMDTYAEYHELRKDDSE